MQVQAAETEALAAQRPIDQRVAAMAAEAHLADAATADGPVQKLGSIAHQGPVQMLLPVEAMDGEVVELWTAQPLQNLIKAALSFLEAQPWQQFAGDHPVVRPCAAVLAKGLSQKTFRRSVGRGGFQMVDPSCRCRVKHLGHLGRRVQGTHRAEGEQADGAAAAEGAGVHSSEGVSLSWLRRWRTKAAGLRSSTKRLKAL